jgi:hypothetical protein
MFYHTTKTVKTACLYAYKINYCWPLNIQHNDDWYKTLRIATFNIMTLRIMTLSITPFRKMTLSIITPSKTTLSMVTLSITILCIKTHQAQYSAL